MSRADLERHAYEPFLTPPFAHILDGNKHTEEFTTNQGGTLNAEVQSAPGQQDRIVFVGPNNSATVIEADISGDVGQGIIHVIDNVLLPDLFVGAGAAPAPEED